jgi:hypothetical protein
MLRAEDNTLLNEPGPVTRMGERLQRFQAAE